MILSTAEAVTLQTELCGCVGDRLITFFSALEFLGNEKSQS